VEFSTRLTFVSGLVFRPRRSCGWCGMFDRMLSGLVAVGLRNMRYADSGQISTVRVFRCSGS